MVMVAESAACDGATGPSAAFGTPMAGTTPPETVVARTSKSGFVVHGARTFPAGRLPVTVSAVGGDREVGIGRIHSGYSFQQVRQDLTTFGQSFGRNGPSKKGLRALNRVVDNVTFYGGVF